MPVTGSLFEQADQFQFILVLRASHAMAKDVECVVLTLEQNAL
jgi:hypothetical protein